MPLITDDDDSAITIKPTPDIGSTVPTISITSNEYRGVAQDTKVTPAHTLMPMIEGSNWTVDYFSQLLNSDSPLIQQAPTSSGSLQQYRRIKKLDIRVTSPLSTQQDSETKVMRAQGTAVIYAGLVPNENDVFVADIGLGLPAVLKVISTEKMSYMQNAAYEISYAVMGQDQAMLDDLVSKTVQTFVFHKDNVAYGQDPLIELQQYASIDELGIIIDELTRAYISEFIDRNHHTFIAPLQDQSIYDPYLVNFLEHVLNATKSPDLFRMTKISVMEDLVYRQPSLWDALEESNPHLLEAGFTRVGVVPTSYFSGNPTARGLRWSGIDMAVYPADPHIGFAGLKQATVKPLYEYIYATDEVVPKFYPRQNYAVSDNDATQTTTPVNTTTVFADDYYVFSQKFYQKDPTMDAFEREVWNCLTGVALDPEQLTRTAKISATWGAIERYYRIPVLLHLLRHHLRTYQVWK